MNYQKIKNARAYCPKCSRKMELLLPESPNQHAESFYICFKCRTVGQFHQGELPTITVTDKKLAPQKQTIEQLLSSLPEKYTYKARGSQLHKNGDAFQRKWLSLAEYETVFCESLPYNTPDFRKEPHTCKWCAANLVAPRRSFCSDRCARAYGKATFFSRSMPTLPYRIASRDRFYCRATGEDLALINRFGVRIPATSGKLAIHHLVFVAHGGSDHESNLITLSADAHTAYHTGDPEITAIIDHIRDEQLTFHHEKMRTIPNQD